MTSCHQFYCPSCMAVPTFAIWNDRYLEWQNAWTNRGQMVASSSPSFSDKTMQRSPLLRRIMNPYLRSNMAALHVWEYSWMEAFLEWQQTFPFVDKQRTDGFIIISSDYTLEWSPFLRKILNPYLPANMTALTYKWKRFWMTDIWNDNKLFHVWTNRGQMVSSSSPLNTKWNEVLF